VPNVIVVLLVGWLAVILLMSVMWLLQRRTGDAGIVDLAWSSGIVLLVVYYAVVLMAIGAPYGGVTLFTHALMLFLLFRVTVIPATEARALESRGEAYRRYQQTTRPFIPWPPRSDAS
jgi:steroid 5-alpha reductase family enzyme